MPNLDISTLSFVAVYCSILYCVVLSLIAFTHSKTRGIKIFSAGFACFALGFFLLANRSTFNDWLTIVLANTLICLAISCFRMGLAKFLKFKNNYYIYELFLLVLMSAALVYFTFIHPSVIARVVNVSIYVAIISFACSWQLLRISDVKMALAQIVTAIPFVTTGVFYAFRAIYALFEAEIGDFMQAGTMHQLAFLELIFLILMSTFGMLLLVTTKLENKLLHQNVTDSLTGLYNRRALEVHVGIEVARTKRHKLKLSILMIDLDFFKAVNDNYGHQVGDTVLATLGKRLIASLRTEDIIIRYGGEEFLVVLPETDVQQAIKVAEKLRIAIKKSPLCDSPLVSMTASIGVGTMFQDESLDVIIERVDHALYDAKDTGRDKVSLAS